MSASQTTSETTTRFDDALLLFQAMKIVAAVDGQFTAREEAVVRNMLATLPAFDGIDFERLQNESLALTKEHGGLLESIPALAELSTPQAKERCLLLSYEVAFSSTGAHAIEKELLASFERILEVDAQTASKMRDIVRIKYQ